MRPIHGVQWCNTSLGRAILASRVVFQATTTWYGVKRRFLKKSFRYQESIGELKGDLPQTALPTPPRGEHTALEPKLRC